ALRESPRHATVAGAAVTATPVRAVSHLCWGAAAPNVTRTSNLIAAPTDSDTHTHTLHALACWPRDAASCPKAGPRGGCAGNPWSGEVSGLVGGVRRELSLVHLSPQDTLRQLRDVLGRVPANRSIPIYASRSISSSPAAAGSVTANACASSFAS